MSFDTKLISSNPQDVALDGSEVRVLCRVPRASMAHFTLAPKAVSKAIVLPELEEVWYFISGRGRMWRQLAGREDTVDVGPGVCITIPAGTHFQFRSDDFEPLTAIGATMPPWTPEKAGHIVAGCWEPTV
jgi:mannose-6-phosphate isomerase-like protein (cupin superfamily)